jgi:hypothetical protein
MKIVFSCRPWPVRSSSIRRHLAEQLEAPSVSRFESSTAAPEFPPRRRHSDPGSCPAGISPLTMAWEALPQMDANT